MKKTNVLAACGMGMAMLSACQSAQQSTECQQIGLCPEKFGTATVDGKEVKLFTLKNSKGAVAQFTNIGAKLVTLYMPDRDGKMADVVLGYATAAEYAACDNAAGKGEPFFGATIGRYGNRIAEGKFSLDGVEYNVEQNEGTNSLHGGSKGFYAQVWETEQEGDKKITFRRTSPDGEMGFPGNLETAVTYELTDTNSVVISYVATTDKPTVVNLTNHSFFNLAGEGDETITDEMVRIMAEHITPVDDKLIPTGELMPVDGTAFDFRFSHLISDSLQSQDPQLLLGKGYDHNFVLSDCPDANGLRFAAEVTDPQSGRVMKVLTTEPAVQFYIGNFQNGSEVGKSGKAYGHRSGLCLETQHNPNSPNVESFPSVRLNPGETYKHVCVYAFSVTK